MAGMVAAGQGDTAAAGAAILDRGGNAVDAAIAACAASFVAEPLLASAGGAGIMTLALPGQEPAVVDFFSDMPGLGLGSAPADFAASAGADFGAIEIDFGVTRQQFHVGRAAAAVPGALPGLAEAHRRFGSLALADLMAPAVHLATEGVLVSAETAHVFGLLWQILGTGPDTARVMAGGRLPRPGDRLRNPDLAATLRDFAAAGRTPDRMLEGLLHAFSPARGGLISEDDVRAYRPLVCAPLAERLGDWAVLSPATPGGRLALTITRALADAPPAADEAAEVLRYALASRAGHAQRQHLTGPGSTTHISVVDRAGGAASVTLTNGEGCGYLIPGTGVQLNNFLGEEDLNPHGFHRHVPGQRLPTMIAPSVGVRRGVPCLALGSGGSNRIRSAVGQVLYRRVVRGAPLADAVAASRVHAEDDVVWVETGGLADPEAALAALRGAFATVHGFPGRDFFFGGVHAVEVDEHGLPWGVGDARRGGATAP